MMTSKQIEKIIEAYLHGNCSSEEAVAYADVKDFRIGISELVNWYIRDGQYIHDPNETSRYEAEVKEYFNRENDAEFHGEHPTKEETLLEWLMRMKAKRRAEAKISRRKHCKCS